MENELSVKMPLNDITLIMLGYMPDGCMLWTTDEPFTTVHELNGKYIFSTTGQELKYVSDLQQAYYRFTNKNLNFKNENDGK